MPESVTYVPGMMCYPSTGKGIGLFRRIYFLNAAPEPVSIFASQLGS